MDKGDVGAPCAFRFIIFSQTVAWNISFERKEPEGKADPGRM